MHGGGFGDGLPCPLSAGDDDHGLGILLQVVQRGLHPCDKRLRGPFAVQTCPQQDDRLGRGAFGALVMGQNQPFDPHKGHQKGKNSCKG